MAKLISKCPTCGETLKISSLQCPDCGLELRSDFSLSPFDQLNREQHDFLLEFLRCQGNLKALQEALGINYPNAKKQLLDLLIALGLEDENAKKETPQKTANNWEDMDMNTIITDISSSKASEIIKAKLKECGGKARLNSLTGNDYELWFVMDGEGFGCNGIADVTFNFDIFDAVVAFLKTQKNYRAKKGNGRQRIGVPSCDASTIMGDLALNYFGKKPGETIFAPDSVLFAVLDWAGIAHNERGYLSLTAEYLEKLS